MTSEGRVFSLDEQKFCPCPDIPFRHYTTFHILDAKEAPMAEGRVQSPDDESMTRYLAMLRDLCPNDAGSDHAWGWQESGDIYWLHICAALEAGWSLGQLDVTSGQRHRVVNRDPLTVEASVLCLGCQDHGWFRDGRWVSA